MEESLNQPTAINACAVKEQLKAASLQFASKKKC